MPNKVSAVLGEAYDGLNCIPETPDVEILITSMLEWDRIWRWGLSSGN